MLEFKLKIILLGDGAVGKTSLIRKFVYDEFDDKYIMTFGSKTTKKVLDLKSPKDGSDAQMTLMISDIMGQRDVAGVQDAFMFGAKGAIIVCDKTRKETLDNMDVWIENVKKVCGDIPIVLMANKNDLTEESAFDISELSAIADKHYSMAFPSSAKTGENVELAFNMLGEALLALRV